MCSSDLRWDENIEEIVIDKGKRKKKTILTDAQIAQVKKVYNNWQGADTGLYEDVPELCKSATLEDIRAKNYSLAPSKYIEFVDHDLDIDYEKEMARVQDEMRLLMVSEELSQSMLKDAFKGIGYGID